MDKIELLENELVELAGPLGKFVVKKQLKKMGLTRKEVLDTMFLELIRRSVANAVFDPQKQKTAIKELRRKLATQTMG